jgi:hypothetical protein
MILVKGFKLQGWSGAGPIPSTEPTSSGASVELFFVLSQETGAVDCHALLRIVCFWAGCCWPLLALNAV